MADDRITGTLSSGKVSGSLSPALGSLSGSLSSALGSLSGDLQLLGQTIVYDAEWGSIRGDIDLQIDLQNEFSTKHDKMDAMTVQEVQSILYMNAGRRRRNG